MVMTQFRRTNEIPGVGWWGSLVRSRRPGLLDTLVTLHSRMEYWREWWGDFYKRICFSLNRRENTKFLESDGGVAWCDRGGRGYLTRS